MSETMHQARLLCRIRRRRIAPPMGTIRVPVTVQAWGGLGEFRADFLLDTGATDCFAPAAALRKIGVQPVGRMAYELADGRVVEYEFGLAQLRFLDQVTLGEERFGAVCLADASWNGANLAGVDWAGVQMLGDERIALQEEDREGKPKPPTQRRQEYWAAIRANRQLAAALRHAGMDEEAARFMSRAEGLLHAVRRLQ